MNSMRHEPDIRRILVALDASPHSLAALEAAGELASRLQAELTGLFVEDIDLLRGAALPFTRQVGAFSRGGRRLDTRQLERQLQDQAEQARQAVVATAERVRVRWSFRVTRGQVAAEVATASADSDLLIMGKTGWAPGSGKHLGATARSVLARTPCLALMLQEGMRLGLPLIVVFDGSPSSQRALEVAAQLGREGETRLNVILLASENGAFPSLQEQVDNGLAPRGLEARYQTVIGGEAARLVRAVQAVGRGLLVLPGEGPLLQSEVLQRLIHEIDCPTLVVRAGQ